MQHQDNWRTSLYRVWNISPQKVLIFSPNPIVASSLYKCSKKICRQLRRMRVAYETQSSNWQLHTSDCEAASTSVEWLIADQRPHQWNRDIPQPGTAASWPKQKTRPYQFPLATNAQICYVYHAIYQCWLLVQKWWFAGNRWTFFMTNWIELCLQRLLGWTLLLFETWSTVHILSRASILQVSKCSTLQ